MEEIISLKKMIIVCVFVSSPVVFFLFFCSWQELSKYRLSPKSETGWRVGAFTEHVLSALPNAIGRQNIQLQRKSEGRMGGWVGWGGVRGEGGRKGGKKNNGPNDEMVLFCACVLVELLVGRKKSARKRRKHWRKELASWSEREEKRREREREREREDNIEIGSTHIDIQKRELVSKAHATQTETSTGSSASSSSSSSSSSSLSSSCWLFWYFSFPFVMWEIEIEIERERERKRVRVPWNISGYKAFDVGTFVRGCLKQSSNRRCRMNWLSSFTIINLNGSDHSIHHLLFRFIPSIFFDFLFFLSFFVFFARLITIYGISFSYRDVDDDSVCVCLCVCVCVCVCGTVEELNRSTQKVMAHAGLFGVD